MKALGPRRKRPFSFTERPSAEHRARLSILECSTFTLLNTGCLLSLELSRLPSLLTEEMPNRAGGFLGKWHLGGGLKKEWQCPGSKGRKNKWASHSLVAGTADCRYVGRNDDCEGFSPTLMLLL